MEGSKRAWDKEVTKFYTIISCITLYCYKNINYKVNPQTFLKSQNLSLRVLCISTLSQAIKVTIFI